MDGREGERDLTMARRNEAVCLFSRRWVVGN